MSQIDQFARLGFLVLPEFLPGDLVDRLKPETDRWVDDGLRARPIACAVEPEKYGRPPVMELEMRAHGELVGHPPLMALLTWLMALDRLARPAKRLTTSASVRHPVMVRDRGHAGCAAATPWGNALTWRSMADAAGGRGSDKGFAGPAQYRRRTSRSFTSESRTIYRLFDYADSGHPDVPIPVSPAAGRSASIHTSVMSVTIRDPWPPFRPGQSMSPGPPGIAADARAPGAVTGRRERTARTSTPQGGRMAARRG
ncbi:hypothetical protein [Sphaerisporangium sp. NPDC051011]|uniref:hypothetical protein n=1 Tax=Sphaerisporangium sp. NPDC051011 TaxID=3155792 RepID=UPI0033FDD9A7